MFDLSNWELVFSGVELICVEIFEWFIKIFKFYGFCLEVLIAGYGMVESVVGIILGLIIEFLVILNVDKVEFIKNWVLVIVDENDSI